MGWDSPNLNAKYFVFNNLAEIYISRALDYI